MKPRVFLVVLVVLVMTSIAQAQSSRIAFATDRGTTDFDLFTMKEDGTDQTRITDESDASRRPSYSFNGQNMIYDVGGDVWIVNTSGTPSEQNLTAVLVGECSGNDVCHEADAGPRINAAGDFLIVFTRDDTPGPLKGDILLATVDVSEGELVDIETVVDDSLINYQPSWCGNDYVIWSREIPAGCEPHCAADTEYWWELCIQEVDEDGPIGFMTCLLGASHQMANQYPSCNSSGDMVAFAQSPNDTKDGQGGYVQNPHEICTMDLQAGSHQDIEDSVECLVDNDTDDTRPVWSPGGTQLAYAKGDLDDLSVYEIYKVNALNLPIQIPSQVTNNDDPDDDPDWGPASIP